MEMDYRRVIEDFNNGKIDRNKWVLVMDNDSGYWRYLSPETGELTYEMEDLYGKMGDEMEETYGKPGGYADLVDILNAAGVNAEWC